MLIRPNPYANEWCFPKAAKHEEWRPVPGFRGLSASSLGRVSQEIKGITNPHTDDDGYKIVSIRMGPGNWKLCKVHRLVCMAFHGPPTPERPLVAHLDGSKDNNIPANLAWVDAQENSSHAVQHGTMLKGEQHPRAVLSEPVVQEIWRSSESCREIGRRLGLNAGTIKTVRAGKTWSHVTKHLARGDWPLPKRKIALPDAMVVRGSLREAAASLGVSQTSIQRRRREIAAARGSAL